MDGSWLEAFALTQIVEAPIYVLALRGSIPRRVLLALGASAITHPIVWFVMPQIVADYWTMVAVAETFAVGTEAVYLKLLGVERPLLWALLANATSVAIGFAYYALRAAAG